jgi:methyl-accepting chemotaxis protein
MIHLAAGLCANLGSLAAVPPQAAAPDTLVMVAARTSFETATGIATICVAFFLLAVAVILFLILLQVHKGVVRLRKIVQDAGRGVDPILEKGRSVAENVDFISAVVRTDVEKLGRTVSEMGDRLKKASDQMERRIEEFNTLVELVQSEAEEIFVNTASTLRGVQEGAKNLGGPGRLHEPPRPDSLIPSGERPTEESDPSPPGIAMPTRPASDDPEEEHETGSGKE